PLDRAVVAVVAACGVGALCGHASDDTARWRPVARCPGTMFRMSEPVSGFDARPDYDPTDHGFTPVTTDEGRLRQLVEYLEAHVPAFTDTVAIPWEGTAEEVAAARSKANDRAARMPDYIVHTSMLVLGAGVDHTLPFVAYGGSSASFSDGVVAGVAGD